MLVDVTTWYLEMLDAKHFCPTFSNNPKLVVTPSEIPSPEFSRFLYTSVGQDWYWIDRLQWTYSCWLAYLQCPNIHILVAYVSGTPAGYIELEAQLNKNVKIAYFGILRQFQGQGIGGHLLSFGVKQAWEMGAQRVWLHTCSLDGPYALANYQKRGFQIYKEETQTRELPNKAIGSVLGA